MKVVEFHTLLHSFLCFAFISWLPSIVMLNVTSDVPPEVAQIESDFMNWVARVDARFKGAVFQSNIVAQPQAVNNIVTVDARGNADYTRVQDAINAVASYNNKRIVIQIAAGVYNEKVKVPKNKPLITFQGAGRGLTTITWHDTASSSGSTHDSASVAIESDYFIARDMTFRNSAPAPPPGASRRQAVALRISGDKASFYGCNFYGAQDTLYDDKGRHYFENCFIEGSIDFICGDGQSLYQGCQLHAIARPFGSLTAQKRSSAQEETGFSFVNCKVTGSGLLYLGRAWGPYSRVVFSYTYMDNIIVPQGWFNWGHSNRDRTVFYGQHQCFGPGAKENGRVTWSHELTDFQAAAFQSLSFVDGEMWIHA